MNTRSCVALFLLVMMTILTRVTVDSYNVTNSIGVMTKSTLDDHYLWTDSWWYRIIIVCLELISLNSIIKAFNMYQIDHEISKYVKHYLVCLIMNLLLRLLGKICIFNDRSSDYIKEIEYAKLFVHACTNSWQIVMSIELLYYLRYINKINTYSSNISKRNIIYHLFSWVFSVLWTLSAILLESGSQPIGPNVKLKYKNNWLLILQLNSYLAIFIYLPGLVNIIINIMILLLYAFRYYSNVKSSPEKSKCIEKIMIRKQLSIILITMWVVDFLILIDRGSKWPWLRVVQDLTKATHGSITCFILMLKCNIITDMHRKVHQYWYRYRLNLNGQEVLTSQVDINIDIRTDDNKNESFDDCTV